jgi:uncharacterized membrane protein YfcA
MRSFIIGLLAGSFGGLIGLGGGVVIVPLLVAWVGLSQHAAHATSLVAVVFTGLLGGYAYATGGAVDWKVALTVAITSTLLAALSASFASRISALRLRRIFGIVLIVVAFLLPFGSQIAGSGIPVFLQLPASLLAGALAGILAGLLGVGGGSVVVPLLILVFGFDQHLAQGTSLAIMIPAGIAGAIVHLRKRNISLGVLPGLIPGVALGAFLGGRTALGIPELPLQLGFAAFMIWTGIRYVR